MIYIGRWQYRVDQSQTETIIAKRPPTSELRPPIYRPKSIVRYDTKVAKELIDGIRVTRNLNFI